MSKSGLSFKSIITNIFLLVCFFCFSGISVGQVSNVTVKIPAPILPTLPDIPETKFLVTDFGAKPNDGIDDTQAIQKAMDVVSAKGGGRIVFPDGLYDIAVLNEATLSNTSNEVFLIRPKISLEAENSRKAVLRLGDNQLHYGAIFRWKETGNMDDVRIKGLVIDANGMNNKPITYDDFKLLDEDGKVRRWLPRVVISSRNGKRVEIENVHFTNLININTINIGVAPNSKGDALEKTTDVTISNCLFDNIGWQEYDFDHSTIYTQSSRFMLKNNVFKSLNGAGTLSARCAIEIHGSDQTVINNEIIGFTIGINVTGTGVVSHRQLLENNKFLDVARGIYFWSFARDAYPNETMLKDVVIKNNFIRISPDAWLASAVPSRTHLAGITSNPGNSSPIENLLIEQNTITTEGFKKAADTYTLKSNECGIALNNSTKEEFIEFKNVHIINNVIGRNLGPSIGGGAKIEGLIIKNNKLLEPEMATLSVLNSRAAINLTSVVKNFSITNNEIKDIEIPNNLNYGIVINKGGKNQKNTIEGNKIEPSSIPLQKK